MKFWKEKQMTNFYFLVLMEEYNIESIVRFNTEFNISDFNFNFNIIENFKL